MGNAHACDTLRIASEGELAIRAVGDFVADEVDQFPATDPKYGRFKRLRLQRSEYRGRGALPVKFGNFR